MAKDINKKKKRKGTRLRYVIVVPPYPDVHREKDSSKKKTP
jgi:hypothetical protein